jgi:acetyl esterase/lipase
MNPAAVYLALGVVAGVTTLAALVRIPSGGKRDLVWFLTGFAAFHFADVLLAAGVAVTVIAALLGVFRASLAFAALLPGVAALCGLFVVRRRSRTIADTLHRALQQTLGNAVRSHVSPASIRTESRNPLRLRQPGVERIADLSYGDAGVRNLLDLYRPATREAQTALPILLWIHGGAWIMGHKTQQGLPLMYGMAKRGWMTVGANYRLGPKSRFPDPLIDIKRVIGWLRQNAAAHGGDPDFIVIAGGSAGGHLATLAALTPNQPQYQPGFEMVDTSLAGLIPLYSRFDFIDRSGAVQHRQFLMNFLGNNVMPCSFEENPSIWDQASPIAQLNSAAPPMFIVHGTHDSIIPLAEAIAFVDAARAASKQPVVFASLNGAQHAWDLFNTPWAQNTVDAVYAFCTHLQAQQRARHG